MTDTALSIGTLAKATGTKVKTIRWYERVGLLAAPARTAGNYRAYGPPHLARLSFIRRARDLASPAIRRMIFGGCDVRGWRE